VSNGIEKCNLCYKDYYGDYKIIDKTRILECKKQTEQFKGCITASNGNCNICDIGYYANESGGCTQVD
jgi:hypothetical protein